MNKQLRIMHCLRSPLGGLFRHVCDLSEAQVASGHKVGIICDAASGGETANSRLNELAEILPLGVSRISMSRQIGRSDVTAYQSIKRLVNNERVQILHGHGAKGGAYSRLVTRSLKKTDQDIASFYTPHGGSLHYDKNSIKGRIYLSLERAMMSMTDGIIFESAYSARIYAEKVGVSDGVSRIIPNGLHEYEFAPHTPSAGAVEVIFVGELRHLKGVDVLLHALANIHKVRPLSAHFYGDGPDSEEFVALANDLGLSEIVDFPGRMPARRAFDSGQLLIVPSRAESFPYIVLEAGACAIPLIVTNVGGIPEIIGSHGEMMIRPDSVHELKLKIEEFLDDPSDLQMRAKLLQTDIHNQFTVEHMTRQIATFYNDKVTGTSH